MSLRVNLSNYIENSNFPIVSIKYLSDLSAWAYKLFVNNKSVINQLSEKDIRRIMITIIPNQCGQIYNDKSLNICISESSESETLYWFAAYLTKYYKISRYNTTDMNNFNIIDDGNILKYNLNVNKKREVVASAYTNSEIWMNKRLIYMYNRSLGMKKKQALRIAMMDMDLMRFHYIIENYGLLHTTDSYEALMNKWDIKVNEIELK